MKTLTENEIITALRQELTTANKLRLAHDQEAGRLVGDTAYHREQSKYWAGVAAGLQTSITVLEKLQEPAKAPAWVLDEIARREQVKICLGCKHEGHEHVIGTVCRTCGH